MENEKKILVSFKEITKTNILDQVNFEIFHGECVGIMGKNNIGKNVLANLIANFEHPTAGFITYNLTKPLKYDIGLTFSNNDWPMGATVRDILKLYCGFYKINIDDAWVQELVTLINFEQNFKKPLKGLKPFEKSLFDLILALIHNPELLVIDDLSSNLSFDFSFKILKFLKELNIKKKKTIILVSPSSTQVEYLCDRVLFLKNQKIIIKNVKEILAMTDNFKTYLITHLKEFY